MIGIISSTIAPPSKTLFHETRSSYSTEERTEHTLKTVESFRGAGLADHEIYLFDNSLPEDFEKFKSQFSTINIFNIQQYQFNNKSINEHLLLLTGIRNLPDETPIIKVSGRYRLNGNFSKEYINDFDFVLKTTDFERANGTISTRCYTVRNKKVLEDVLSHSFFELFTYGMRMVGPRSAAQYLKGIVQPQISEEPTISIEMSMARAIKLKGYSYKLVDTIGVEGLAAVSTDFVNE